MGLKHLEYLAVPSTLTNGKVFGCRRCKTHLTTSEQIESKVRPLPLRVEGHVGHASDGCLQGSRDTRSTALTLLDPQNFNGQHGRAYLFTNVSVSTSSLPFALRTYPSLLTASTSAPVQPRTDQ